MRLLNQILIIIFQISLVVQDLEEIIRIIIMITCITEKRKVMTALLLLNINTGLMSWLELCLQIRTIKPELLQELTTR
ncbi:hypothetical protein D3C79_1059650 [compost metagenome]